MPNRPGTRFGGSEIVVIVTTGSEDEAGRIGLALVDAGLAACANILPRIRSIYRWEGKVADETESLILLKSRPSLFGALEKEIKKLHSYSVPEVIALPIVKGSEKYLQWIQAETRKILK